MTSPERLVAKKAMKIILRIEAEECTKIVRARALSEANILCDLHDNVINPHHRLPPINVHITFIAKNRAWTA